MDNLYQEHILDHARNPRNKGVLDNYDIKQDGSNPSCGDTMVLYLRINNNGSISRVLFDGEGCAISQAGASLVSEYIKDMTLEEIKKITPEKVYKLFGVTPNPARQKCALLFLHTLFDAIKK